jgi:hypothetical protein
MSATPEALPNVIERPAPAPACPPVANPPAQAGQPLRLAVAPAAAAKQITPWLAKGLAVRKRRLRDLSDLDKARAEKKAWVAAYTDTLTKLFLGPAVGEACNDWAGRIWPEYAPVGLFVEQFYEEMDHRLRRLQAVVDHLEDLATEEAARPAAEHSTTGDRTTGGAAGGGAAEAAGNPPPRDEHKGKSLNWARLFPTAEELAGRSAEAPPADQAGPPRDLTTSGPPAAPQADHRSDASPPAIPAAGALTTVVKPVGLLLVSAADEAKAVCEFLADLAVAPRVVAATDDDPADPEVLVAGPTPPAFALVWPPAAGPGQPTPAAVAAFQFRLGFLVGRLGAARVCLVGTASDPRAPAAASGTSLATVTLDSHGGWQLPLARTLKRAGVQVDLNRLC